MKENSDSSVQRNFRIFDSVAPIILALILSAAAISAFVTAATTKNQNSHQTRSEP
jgi:hypothetical protein